MALLHGHKKHVLDPPPLTWEVMPSRGAPQSSPPHPESQTQSPRPSTDQHLPLPLHGADPGQYGMPPVSTCIIRGRHSSISSSSSSSPRDTAASSGIAA